MTDKTVEEDHIKDINIFEHKTTLKGTSVNHFFFIIKKSITHF